MSHQAHNVTTYAEGKRSCKICGDEFKLHAFNRFRETCSDECHRKLMAEVVTFKGPGSMDHVRRAHQHRSKGAASGDPRDEETLVEQLFIMTWRPCEGCRGTEFKIAKDIYHYYCANRSCRKHRGPRSGTIFLKTQTPLTIWLAIMRRQAQSGSWAKNMQIKTISRDFGIGRNTAMVMLQKIRGRDNDDPYIRWAMHPELPPIRGVLLTKDK